jgi:hypothetical protein
MWPALSTRKTFAHEGQRVYHRRMQQLTLQTTNRTAARILRDGQVIGHVGLMAGGSCAFVNASAVFGEKAAFVAHSTTCEAGLAELIKLLTKEGLL